MTALSKLTKTTTKSGKRVGRGIGSGKGGHTVGRGSKGTKARGKVKPLFTGTKSKKSFIKRLPLLRGKGKLKSRKSKPVVVNLQYLEAFLKTKRVNIKSLAKAGIVDLKQAEANGVKILGEGEIKKVFEVELPISKSAAKKVEKAGGKIIKPEIKKIKKIRKTKKVKTKKTTKVIKAAKISKTTKTKQTTKN